jgi:sugar/nucleoside kinase (ribokinase family)
MRDDYDAIVYGTVCLDEIWRVEALAPPNGYVDIQEAVWRVGGEAANTAIALAKWGVRVALVGNALGDDAKGRLLRDLFAQDAPEISTEFLTWEAGRETPYCLCIATPDGDRTMYGIGFTTLATPPLRPERFPKAAVFTMDPNDAPAGRAACLKAAQAGIAPIPMDYTRDEAVSQVAAHSVTSSNHVGSSPAPADLARYAAQFRDRYGSTCLVTHGAEGCYVAPASEKGDGWRVPAYPAPALVDSTGAGDVFRAGLLYGRLNGWELLRTIQFASAAASLNCGAMGGWGGVRPVSEILAFQRQCDSASA